jgi:general secretion pathway protein G
VPDASQRDRCAPELDAARSRVRGFTLIEMAIVMIIVAILAAIAIPSYRGYLEKNKEATAISDIQMITAKLKAIMMEDPTKLPDTLAQINFGNTLPVNDPWGHPYMYFPIYGHLGDHSYMNNARKDHSFHPINSDFDLGSMGPDGQSNKNLQNVYSRDDIIRANDGAFIGKASTYDP